MMVPKYRVNFKSLGIIVLTVHSTLISHLGHLALYIIVQQYTDSYKIDKLKFKCVGSL